MIHSYRGHVIFKQISQETMHKLVVQTCKLDERIRHEDELRYPNKHLEDTKRPSTHWEWAVTKYEKQPIKIKFASNVLPLPSVSFTRLLANAKELVFTEEVFHHLCQKDGRPGNHPFALIRPKRGPHIEDVVRGGKMPTSSRRNHGIGFQCKSHDGTGDVLRYAWLFSTTSSVS